MAHLNQKGEVVADTAYERDTEAAMKRPGPHCPYCLWPVAEHANGSIKPCLEAWIQLTDQSTTE